MTAKAITHGAIRGRRGAQPRPRLWLRAVAAYAVVLAAVSSFPVDDAAALEPLRGEVTATTAGGYARLVFSFPADVDAEVRLANGVVVINFSRPVTVDVDRLNVSAAGYVSAARRDPDGSAVRIALARKVTANSMSTGDKLFVDFLPDTWTGVPPGLPKAVIEDLARRAREAERKQRQQREAQELKRAAPIRVRVGAQPTFTRYVFEMPDLIAVSADRGKDKMAIVFDAPLKFDLADALATLPPTVATIDAQYGGDKVTVGFTLIGKVDVRSFREDNNYVVDIAALSPKERAAGRNAFARPGEPPVPGAPPPLPTAPAAATPPPAGAVPVPVPRPAAAPPAAATPAAAPVPPAAAETPAVPDRAPPPQASAPPVVSPPVTTPAVVAPPPATPTPTPPPAAEAAKPAPREAGAPVVAAFRRQGDNVRLTFPFATPTPAAVFRRVDTLWLVFDTGAPVDVGGLVGQPGRMVKDATVTRSGGGQVVRIKLERPKLASIETDGPAWTVTLGDMMLEPTRPLALSRAVTGPSRANVTIPFEDPRQLHRLADPDVGDTLLVVTALGPARGFLKSQDFVEFRALASSHGVAVQPLADDLIAELLPDKIVLSRPTGLTVSTGAPSGGARRGGSYRPVLLDSQNWGFDRQTAFPVREQQLLQAAADAPDAKRTAARLDLARFYLAREAFSEAKAVLAVAAADERPTAEDPSALVLRAIANVMMGRSDDALKDLADPAVGNQHDAQLWRAIALARQGKWVEAREKFAVTEAAVATQPIELQRAAMLDSIRASIEVRDFADATRLLSEFETLGITHELEPVVEVLKGRIAEGLGRTSDALGLYRTAADSWHRPSAAQGRLREIALRYASGELKRGDAIPDLEVLTTTWRGDETESEALQLLARMYTEEARYRDAFHVMRIALAAYPNSEMTRRIQDEAAATFDTLFLAGKGDAMPAIDALSLFYDYRELTPIGRRGDEMIRRLADRLVTVDLLDQAAELLQHQVDHRLQGAARSQVAARLAVVYLMNQKPDRALQALRTTRVADLPSDLRNQRLLLEARALADTGRHDLALDVVSNMRGREAERLRADILWTARRWAEAGEQIERLYGERWKEWSPLTQPERGDVLRAAIGYALGDDALGLDRFRQKYGPKMADGPDRRAFEIVASPLGVNNPEFGDVAKSIASASSLDSFLRDMRERYPESGAAAPITKPASAARPAPAATPPSNGPQSRTPSPAAPQASVPTRPAS